MTSATAVRIVDLVSDSNDRKYEPVGRMATAIIEICNSRGACTSQDLSAKGFTPDDIAQYWHMAKSIAEIEMKLMNEASVYPSVPPKRRN